MVAQGVHEEKEVRVSGEGGKGFGGAVLGAIGALEMNVAMIRGRYRADEYASGTRGEILDTAWKISDPKRGRRKGEGGSMGDTLV